MSRDEDFEQMVKELQQKIDRREEETYSKKVIREYRNPSNFGFIENPDATGQIKGSCGDTMKMDLRIKDNVIQDARFWTDGCGASLACGNMLTSMIEGKNIDEADSLSSEQLLGVLDDLPEEHQHCAKLAVDTLHEVIKGYHKEEDNVKIKFFQ